MRDRHLPRLCRACHTQMARQEDTCSRCGTQWATEDRPRTPLHVIPGRVPTDAAGKARAVNEARLAMDRWVDEGGRVPFEAAAVPRATGNAVSRAG
jgi:hypothetical protein